MARAYESVQLVTHVYLQAKRFHDEADDRSKWIRMIQKFNCLPLILITLKRSTEIICQLQAVLSSASHNLDCFADRTEPDFTLQ